MFFQPNPQLYMNQTFKPQKHKEISLFRNMTTTDKRQELVKKKISVWWFIFTHVMKLKPSNCKERNKKMNWHHLTIHESGFERKYCGIVFNFVSQWTWTFDLDFNLQTFWIAKTKSSRNLNLMEIVCYLVEIWLICIFFHFQLNLSERSSRLSPLQPKLRLKRLSN